MASSNVGFTTQGGTIVGSGLHASGTKPKKKNKHPKLKPEPPKHQEGLRVVLAPIKGLTAKGTFKSWAKPFILQCPPQDTFTITFGHDSQEYETVYDGTFSVLAAKKLTLITFKTLFVETDYPWTIRPAAEFNPWHGRDLLETLVGGTPFMLTCHHYHADRPEWHGAVTLTDYIHTEEEPYTYYSDLTFKHYRDPVQPRLGQGKDWPIHHKLTAKDTLYSLAKKYYGKSSEARAIARANGIKNTNFREPVVHLKGRWKVGATIKIPKPAKPKQAYAPAQTVTAA